MNWPRPFEKSAFVPQRDETDCGAACLAIVLKRLSLPCPTVAEIRDLAGTNRVGTTVAGLLDAARQLGLEPRAVRSPAPGLAALPIPFIAHVVREDLHHFVVVLSVTRGKVRVADPACGLVWQTGEDFLAIWSGVAVLLRRSDSRLSMKPASRPWRDLLRILERHDFLVGELFLISLLIMALGIGLSVSLQVFIDRVLPEKNRPLLDWLAIGLVGVVFFKAIFNGLRGILQAYLARRIDAELFADFYEHLLRLPMRFFDNRHVGDITARFTDAVKIRDVLAGAALLLLVDTTTIAGGAGMLAIYSGRLALHALAILPLAAVGVWLMSRPLRAGQRRILEQGAIVQSQIVESVHSAGVIKALHGEREFRDRGLEKIATLLSRVFRINGLSTAAFALGEVLTGLVLVTVVRESILLSMNGALSAGSVVAVYSILVFMLQPVTRVFGLAPEIQDAVAAVERMREVLRLETEIVANEPDSAPVDAEPDVTMRGVSFRYGSRGHVLEDIDLSIPFGTSLAIVGATGSGKSTLAKLLLRFYEPTAGTIHVGGRDVRSIPVGHLRRVVGYVDQTSVLLNGSIDENLRFFDPSIPCDRIREALEIVGLTEFVASLPDELATRIGDFGVALSGGQRQLLCVARALVRNPPVLILDEAYSQLDPVTEFRLRNKLELIRGGRTTIRIVHRLDAARLADQILVLDSGRIAEMGSHDELLRAWGVYSRLWNDHFGFHSLEIPSRAEPGRIADAVR
jgi:ABC-type bacteriocin/lantibiotic exporter with double-glycine peptidase domain